MFSSFRLSWKPLSRRASVYLRLLVVQLCTRTVLRRIASSSTSTSSTGTNSYHCSNFFQTSVEHCSSCYQSRDYDWSKAGMTSCHYLDVVVFNTSLLFLKEVSVDYETDGERKRHYKVQWIIAFVRNCLCLC